MAVHWDCSECPAFLAVKGLDVESAEWIAFAKMREWFIWTLLVVKFPKGSWKITEKNWREVFVRIRIWQAIENVSAAERFSVDDVKSMIGFSVNAGNSTDAEFSRMISKKLRDRANDSLRIYDRANEAKETTE